jgi:haloalkane dehalogenase
MHYLDEGAGEPVLLLHGEPTWSFLWRKTIPPLAERARVIAPDLIGFGRSDKPTDVDWYSYDKHVASIERLADELGLEKITLVVHDWGGPIGLRLAVEHPDRIARIVIMETGPFTGHQRMSDAWFAFRDFVRDNEDVPIGVLIRGGCKNDPGDEVIAAYDAPYIGAASKAGARAFPLILPTTPEAVGAAEGKRVADGLREDGRPSLVLWADSDPILPFSVGERVSSQLNLTPPRAIKNASHFLQEDSGPEIGAVIAEWLADSG